MGILIIHWGKYTPRLLVIQSNWIRTLLQLDFQPNSHIPNYCLFNLRLSAFSVASILMELENINKFGVFHVFHHCAILTKNGIFMSKQRIRSENQFLNTAT